jgi:hypothetical protein
MKAYFLIVTLTLISFRPNEKVAVNTWIVEKNSTLAIDGSSNINKFTCDIKEYLKIDTLRSVNDAQKKKFVFVNSSLSIDVKRFDCHHKFITADFRKMMKSEAYPNLRIYFVSLDEFHEAGIVKGLVDIELAGRRKRMEVVYKCAHIGGSQLRLQGDKQMNFSDFQLEPPKKIGGLIRINEEINVHFDLFFRKLI